MSSFIALDTETTGIEPGSRIIEIAAQHFEGDEVKATFESLVNPGMPLPPDAAEANGITQEMLDDSPPLHTAIYEFTQWLPDDAEFVIHNAPFDCSVISWDADRCGALAPMIRNTPVINTLVIARALKETRRNGLQALVEHFEIQRIGNAHRALSDADACRQYFGICREKTDIVPAPFSSFVEYNYVPPGELPDMLKGLPALVAEGEPFSFRYVDNKGAETDREITPYGWARKNGTLYFHGFCHMRKERRTFKAGSIVG